ncbi:septal ring lytic transglycosylase RlpA family protein [Paraburkholderia sp. J11-2]|uniref:septal ring lytic transglycosylase RlpA family protein n=1 Tax=Paraburkholderia sp. J11-2 TaxID=2805431 RepID=UPI002AB6D303|nr:septal ring lytic transglycosylase RlpA family protein [Paraburkholderia sp. J11-2]
MKTFNRRSLTNMWSMKPSLRYVGVCAICAFFTACGQIAPRQTACSVDSCRTRHEVVQSGEASWYAEKFQGRQTANGERFDAGSLTAAHRTLPLGSYVRVRSMATGKSVVVRINDRGPYVKGRIIDLSYAAAKTLGLTEARSMRVQIERVENTQNAQAEPDDGGILATGR